MLSSFGSSNKVKNCVNESPKATLDADSLAHAIAVDPDPADVEEEATKLVMNTKNWYEKKVN